ncbi:hypothetical protein BOX15_Mlig032394g3 [Macrostomum lignano]|uniref:Uncharacterized protein n=1 Tax=Macrostomum lignano TaxID=282301 RepID=A0A267HAT8_9PLAT|nr:hypothetical protein BOX15_Mlig032394g3 [Macrostomum lignano]
MNLVSGSAVNKLQQKQLLKQQEALDKRRRKGARLHGEAGAAVCIQRWFRSNQKRKQQQQQQEDGTICGRIRRWWGEVNSSADTFYHQHVSHDAKPTLADLAKKRKPTSSTEQSTTVDTEKQKPKEPSLPKTETVQVEVAGNLDDAPQPDEPKKMETCDEN